MKRTTLSRMAERRDDESRQEDLDWLYGDEETEAEKTRVDSPPVRGSSRRRPGTASPKAYPPLRTSQSRPAGPRTDRPRRTAGGGRPPASPPPGGRPPRRPGPRRRPRVGRIIVRLLVLWLVWLLVVPVIALVRSDTVKATPDGDRPAQQPGTATLLVGSDRRDDLTEAEQRKLGTGTEAGTRTDTMLILYTPPSGSSVLISLPRDSYVPIPGHGRNKLNAAYSIGGAPLLMQTVEQATGLRMDGYLEIGFGGFVNMVDAVGGVNICLDKPMVDKDSHTNLKAGCQDLDGITALGYVRMRKADALGDLGRVKRQQEVIGKVAKKVLTPWTLINPVRYWKVNMAAAGAIRRGDNTSVLTMGRAGLGMLKVTGSNGIKMTVPVSDSNAYTSAGSSVLWDRTKCKELFNALAQGDTSVAKQYSK